MRYTGPGRSPWPMVATIAIAVIVVIGVYLLFFQAR